MKKKKIVEEIPPWKQRKIWREQCYWHQRGKCWYCGRSLSMLKNSPFFATLDHIVPKSAGGEDHFYNLVVCCRDCNTAKGSIC